MKKYSLFIYLENDNIYSKLKYFMNQIYLYSKLYYKVPKSVFFLWLITFRKNIFFVFNENLFIFNEKYLKFHKIYLYPIKFICIQ